MICPGCSRDGADKILDTRDKGDAVRRRRVCLKCGHRWSTSEMPIKSLVYMTCADEARALVDGDNPRLVLISRSPSGADTI